MQRPATAPRPPRGWPELRDAHSFDLETEGLRSGFGLPRKAGPAKIRRQFGHLKEAPRAAAGSAGG